jgi:hypothetical protein
VSRTLELLLAAALGLALLAGCGPGETPAGAEVSEEAPSSDFHTRYGFPGPWSREDANRDDFERDSGACLARSNAARREPGSDDRNAAAYRSFLQCMDERGWTRGLAPASRRVSGAPTSQSGRVKLQDR